MAPEGRQRMKLRAPQNVRELLGSAHPHIKRKIRVTLQLLQSEPEAGKALREELVGLRSYRLGRLRIIYRVLKAGVIDIVAIGPRKTIYEETFRLIKRETKK